VALVSACARAIVHVPTRPMPVFMPAQAQGQAQAQAQAQAVFKDYALIFFLISTGEEYSQPSN